MIKTVENQVFHSTSINLSIVASQFRAVTDAFRHYILHILSSENLLPLKHIYNKERDHKMR